MFTFEGLIDSAWAQLSDASGIGGSSRIEFCAAAFSSAILSLIIIIDIYVFKTTFVYL